MSEHKETFVGSAENNVDVGETAVGRSKELLKHHEKSQENHLSASAERLKVEALFSKDMTSNEHKKASIDDEGLNKKLPRTGGKKDREASYKTTMSHVRQELSPHERVFSRIIHTPVIEKTSEVVGATIARPNAILIGSFTAFSAVTVVYVVARNMGYPLSGFETMGAFILGWSLGLIYDYIRMTISGKSS